MAAIFPEQGPNNQPLLANNDMIVTEFPQNNQIPYNPQTFPDNQYIPAPQYQPGQAQYPSQPQQVVYVQAVPNRERLPAKPTGRQPQRFYCSVCRKPQVSKVTYDMGLGGWIWCLCCITGISCLPCCVEDMQDACHRCPQCQTQVAKDVWLC